MRVMIATFPSTSHLYPVIPLAWALQSAGHEVCVVGHPGMGSDDMAATVTAAGVMAVPVGESVATADVEAAEEGSHLDIPPDAFALDVLTSGPAEWELLQERLLSIIGQCYPLGDNKGMVTDLIDFARSWGPDLVLWDPLCLPAAVAARVAGAAHARVLWGQDKMGWVWERASGRSAERDPMARWMRPLLDRYGLDFSEEMLLGQWSVDLVPQAARLPLDTRTVPLRWVPYNEASVVPEWLRDPPERPRVCLTLGVSSRHLFGKDTGFPLEEMLDVVAGFDIEVVATLNRAQLTGLDRIPENVRTVDFVPLNQLLPSCAAIVHHGGWGTFSVAATHRVPQLILPVPTWDERVAARYAAQRGAGPLLHPAKLTPDELGRQLRRALEEPGFRQGTAELQSDRLAAPSPAEVVPVLERLTAHHRGLPPG
ncbi:activator-dependent family glycosyltransferase [Streptomyces tailanensis]|uniref:activator-dependent family glycosyltransferase n=1 Tax=Streptomyces tailanensis TaxID=2569858 RepID=UPI00122E1147|nr:activator-dependent family glycosyltransferase [Streptomyces tailanensis]